MNKHLLFYFAVIVVFGSGIYFMLHAGPRIQGGAERAAELRHQPAAQLGSAAPPESPSTAGGIRRLLAENLRSPISILLLQIIIIVLAARLCGRLFSRMGQPAVVGEIVAGILLGPSLLGLASPATFAFLFPATSMGALGLLSQVGITVFMFLVGMELNLEQVRSNAHAAVLISHVSIIVPFFLGIALSTLIYSSCASPDISFTSFALFLGIAMSITAFPVLARIIKERGLMGSALGSIAIACAAIDDVTAWCLLSLVVASVKASDLNGALLTVSLALGYMLAMVYLLKPWIARWLGPRATHEAPGSGVVTGVVALAFGSAWVTETIGIHALFGAFLAGAIMPATGGLRSFLHERLETIISPTLLPLFFAFTGLRTQLSLLDGWGSWLLCAGVIAVATAGKLGGSALAARWAGAPWRDSLAIAALMNTRGLMELVVLNIGYDLGILSGRIFAALVLMALVTTWMAGPLLTALGIFGRRLTPQSAGHETSPANWRAAREQAAFRAVEFGSETLPR